MLVLGGCRAQAPSKPNATRAPSAPTSSVIPPPSPEPSPNDRPTLVEVGRFNKPIFVTAPVSDPRLFVVEQEGRIKVLVEGKALPAPFLDIVSSVSSGGERGLFSMAFSPDYATSGLAYVSYTDRTGDSRLDEYRVSSDPNRLEARSRRQILFVKQPFPNHNGGLILFDPSGMLIFGLGDGGSGGDPGNRAQNLSELLGKLVRIDPRHPSSGNAYGIPSDNPFIGRSGARPEIWAYGLRNPWRFAFDPATRDLYVGDVGQNRVEEIDYVPPAAQPGANFGWRKYEGDQLFTDDRIDESRLVRPIHTLALGGPACAVTGGHVYRGEVKSLRGFYIYADFCEGKIKGFRVRGGAAVEHTTFDLPVVSDLASFGEDSAGELYVASLGGSVFRVARAA